MTDGQWVGVGRSVVPEASTKSLSWGTKQLAPYGCPRLPPGLNGALVSQAGAAAWSPSSSPPALGSSQVLPLARVSTCTAPNRENSHLLLNHDYTVGATGLSDPAG